MKPLIYAISILAWLYLIVMTTPVSIGLPMLLIGTSVLVLAAMFEK